MAHSQVFAELAAGTPPAPARVVVLDASAEENGLELPAERLASAQAIGTRPTLVLAGTGHLERPERAGVARLEALAAKLASMGRRLTPAALALPAAVGHPEELALAAAAVCEEGPPLYLLLPADSLAAVQRNQSVSLQGTGETAARRWWGALLALAAMARDVSLVPAVPGRGLCVLATRGGWCGPSPGLAELIPAAPTRVRLDLDFAHLLVRTADQPDELARLAGRLVAAADQLLGGVPGPRRLAIRLQRVAYAVLASGRDPRSFAALAWLNRRLRAFRDGARAASVRLARQHGARGGLEPFPLPDSLAVAETGALDRAVLQHGARHSHLVCLSPWSLAPPETGRDCIGLLPALAWADSIAWRRPDGPIDEAVYGEVLRFAWATALRS